MAKLTGDHDGHLLAGCLGGPSYDIFNYSPQTPQLNTNSRWSREELAMRNFLLSDDGTGRRRIEWQLLVLYGSSSTRPIGFYLTHQNYNEDGELVDNNNQPINNPLPLIYFSNIPGDPCPDKEIN
ncbi:hypothetical protein KR215_003995 [Drosophila sulfurigaster]|nr:hypothetical protein KR215_003995 [Drosophila sulfurigaster]